MAWCGWALIGLVVAGLAVAVFACCVAASDADDYEEWKNSEFIRDNKEDYLK